MMAALAYIVVLSSLAAPPDLQATVDLADWDLASVDDIGFVEVGVLNHRGVDKLVVYDVRRTAPTRRKLTYRTAAPDLSRGPFVVDRFRSGNVNRLGGYFGAFARAPATSVVELGRAPDGEMALSFAYDRTGAGFAGFWIHFFDFKAPDRVFLDAGAVTHLAFDVRGAADITLKVADRRWEGKGDALPIGPLSRFVAEGRLTGEWQRVVIPLAALPPRIDRTELAGLIFEAGQGAGRVFVRDLLLADSADAVAPAVGLKTTPDRPLRIAIWLWETHKIAPDPVERAALVAFCMAQGVTDVFAQIPRSGPATLGPMIADLHAAGVRVDALDGDPHYTMAAKHGIVLDGIRKVSAYNRSAPAAERFDGIRYDNEPYLLPGFGGAHKERILREYLALVRKAAVVAGEGGLAFGVDIPFWFDGHNRFFEPSAQLDGRPVSELVIDAVDNLSIMDYRTVAYGPDGVIAHGIDELNYAVRAGKQVYVGLETVSLPDEVVMAFGPTGKGAAIALTALPGGRVRVVWRPDNTHAAGAGRTLHQTYEATAPAGKLTFQDLRPRDLERVMTQSARELRHIPSFIGFAIHSYESYRPWLLRRLVAP